MRVDLFSCVHDMCIAGKVDSLSQGCWTVNIHATDLGKSQDLTICTLFVLELGVST